MQLKATPKTLRKAIRNALTDTTDDLLENKIFNHVKNFLAQRFSTAIFRSEGVTIDKLDDLYKEITDENTQKTIDSHISEN